MNFFFRLLVITVVVAVTSVGVSLYFVLNFSNHPYFIIFGGLWGIISFLLLFYGFINNHVKEITKTIREISEGGFDKRLNVRLNDPILGEIERNINDMADKLEEKHEWLGKLVNEQTLKLEKEMKVSAEQNKDLEDSKIAMINLVEDIEKEKDDIAQERNRISAILYGIGDGVFVIDKDYKIQIFNAAAASITGFVEKEVIGKQYDSILKFVNEKTGAENDAFIKNVFNVGEVSKMSNSTMLIKKDGGKLPVADSAAPVRDESGDIVGCVVIFRDVSKERHIDKMKTEFISLASHQLRTPLTGIQWVIERFLKKEKLSETGRSYMEDVHLSARKLNELVDLLLNTSRIEEGKVGVLPQKFQLVEFLNNYLKECAPLAMKKNLAITFGEHPKDLEVFTDSGVLRNIVQSIISNAIEYTPQDGKIEISLKKEKENFAFKVSDTGIGIPKDEQVLIFNKFLRGSNAKMFKADGTGLGLYLAKQATDLLGGKIYFESPGELKDVNSKNCGTTFCVEIPLVSKATKEVTGKLV